MHTQPENNTESKDFSHNEHLDEEARIDKTAKDLQELLDRDRQEKIENLKRMRQVPINSKVCRRLFSEENIEEQARIDNFANILQESAERDRQEKSKKWSFDFINEVPLDGAWEWWYKKDGDEWIGMKARGEDIHVPEDDKLLPKQLENENTPVQVRDETVPIIRKRKNDIENGTRNKAVKRKVDFDQCSFLRSADY